MSNVKLSAIISWLLLSLLQLVNVVIVVSGGSCGSGNVLDGGKRWYLCSKHRHKDCSVVLFDMQSVAIQLCVPLSICRFWSLILLSFVLIFKVLTSVQFTWFFELFFSHFFFFFFCSLFVIVVAVFFLSAKDES